jgi:CheY-like chemotaxis protein
MAEDDLGHAGLIQRNLERAGVRNPIIHLEDGEELMDFLFMEGQGKKRELDKPYLLLLDIRMPKIDGIEVLKAIKADDDLKAIPVIVLTTTSNPAEVKRCHELGCSNYITKPIDYRNFVEAIHSLGLFLRYVEIPKLGPQK